MYICGSLTCKYSKNCYLCPFFCSLFNYRFSNIGWVLCKDPAHVCISLFGSQSDVRGQQRVESLFPEEETEAGGQSETSPGITSSHESDRRFQDCSRKQEGKERF